MPTVDFSTSDSEIADGGEHIDTRGEHVLVLAGSFGGDADSYCAERLSASAGTTLPNVLLVSLDDAPDRRVDTIFDRESDRPAKLGIISCEGSRRATTALDPTHGSEVGLGQWVTTVSSPGELTGLNVRIREVLSEWENEDRPIKLCFHSLTTLYQYVDTRTLFRFCHTVTRQVSAVNGQSHFHINPDAVDQQTVAMLSSVFSRVEDRT